MLQALVPVLKNKIPIIQSLGLVIADEMSYQTCQTVLSSSVVHI